MSVTAAIVFLNIFCVTVTVNGEVRSSSGAVQVQQLILIHNDMLSSYQRSLVGVDS